MRYYSLSLTDPATGFLWSQDPNSGKLLKAAASGSPSAATFTSFVNGRTIPGALNVEFSLPVTVQHTPQGNALIRVWGVGLQAIGQQAQLAGQNFVLNAGMQKGLPLANPAQQGLLAQGRIFQAFGNWQGVDQTLDLICLPGPPAPSGGISFSWKPGTPLAAALYSALTQAFAPGYSVTVNITPNLQPRSLASGCYKSLPAFAQALQQYTQPLGAALPGGANYPGVVISVSGNRIAVADGSVVQKTVSLAFQDFIGQPTWISALEVTFKTILRADINVIDNVTFPAGIIPPYALTTPEAAIPNAPSRSVSAFQGKFQVREVHHYANFRQPDPDSWNTTFTAFIIPPNAGILGAA
jgi:hypothetical protein